MVTAGNSGAALAPTLSLNAPADVSVEEIKNVPDDRIAFQERLNVVRPGNRQESRPDRPALRR